MDDFYQILNRVEHSLNRAALVTIVDVKGSSYRKKGTSMLFESSGETIGMLSGGCLETDIKSRVEQWWFLNKNEFEELKGQIQVYDLRSENDADWGRGSGCNGVMTVLIEPVTDSFRHQLQLVKLQMDRRVEAISLRRIENDQCEKRAFVLEDGRVLGDYEDFKEHIDRMDFSNWHQRNQYIPGNKKEKVLQILHHRRPELLIFGAGEDSLPLTELAAKAGWMVVVADWRAAICHEKRFPLADHCLVAAPHELLAGMHHPDAVVIMTHDFQVDQILLPSILEKSIPYVGVLGPHERTKRLLRDTPWVDRLHSPVGLDIGAEGTWEIAVSIMAEIIKTHRQS